MHLTFGAVLEHDQGLRRLNPERMSGNAGAPMLDSADTAEHASTAGTPPTKSSPRHPHRGLPSPRPRLPTSPRRSTHHGLSQRGRVCLHCGGLIQLGRAHAILAAACRASARGYRPTPGGRRTRPSQRGQACHHWGILGKTPSTRSSSRHPPRRGLLSPRPRSPTGPRLPTCQTRPVGTSSSTPPLLRQSMMCRRTQPPWGPHCGTVRTWLDPPPG